MSVRYFQRHLFLRSPNSYFFNFNERFHNCIKSDFSRIWKCTGSGNRNRIQGKYVYHISADGLANGVQPLLGYNFGSGDKKRFQDIAAYTKKCCIVIGILATLLFFVFRRQIIGLFIQDEEVIMYGVRILIAYMLSGPVIGILFMNMNCMQSVGKAFWATILSVLRQGVLLIPLLFLLNALGGLTGVIYGQALTDYIAVILSVLMWRKCIVQLP